MNWPGQALCDVDTKFSLKLPTLSTVDLLKDLGYGGIVLRQFTQPYSGLSYDVEMNAAMVFVVGSLLSSAPPFTA